MAEQLIPFINGVQYNGSNGTAIVAQIPAQQVSDYNVHVISESDNILVLGYDDGAGPNEATYEIGDWVTWKYSVPVKYTVAQFDAEYIKRSDLP